MEYGGLDVTSHPEWQKWLLKNNLSHNSSQNLSVQHEIRPFALQNAGPWNASECITH